MAGRVAQPAGLAPARAAGLAPAPAASLGAALVAGLAALTLTAFLSLPAAASTLWGLRGAGVLHNPTGDGGMPGEFTLGVHAAGGNTYSYVRYQLTANLELGVATVDGGTLGVGPLLLVRLRPESGALPGLSVGLQYREAFVVVSRAVGDPWSRVHLGLRAGLWGPDARPVRPLVGISRVLNPVAVRRPGQLALPIVTVGAEFDGEQLNAALTAQVGRYVQVDLGVQGRGGLRLAGGVSVSRQF